MGNILFFSLTLVLSDGGSSLLVRGTCGVQARSFGFRRVIPTRAGNSCVIHMTLALFQGHPHGSSPRIWETY